MNRFISFLEEKFVPVAAKIGGQKHLVAIRDSFASLMPLILVGAFAVLLNNVFFVPWSLLASYIGEESAFIVWANTNLAPLFSLMESGTFAIIALGLTFSMGYNRAVNEDKDPLSTGLISVASFVLLGALARNNEVVASWVTNFLGAQGIFIGLLVGLITPEIYFAIVRKDWVIKMPDTVPPAVAKGFSAVIPGFIAVFFWALVAYIFNVAAGMNIFTWFETNIAAGLSVLGQNIISIVFISTLIPLLWFFGLHGANMLEAIMSPVYGTMGIENITKFSNGIRAVGTGADELAVWVRGSWDAYVFMGGSGATLPLIIAILVFSKVKSQKEVAKLGLPPGIFMINEPVLFGIPIVLNPVYFIPFILVQPILTLVAFYAAKIGFAGPIVNSVPWTTPPILNAFLATNGSWGAVGVSIINLVIAFVIYMPFVMIANRYEEQREIEEEKIA
ncbi:PTS sugar transporter subunit IIC [Proteiniclasticum sp. SCR006]|uniref:Permease IIC component n=1 Tax=Proteiniclasticum aestuarii TaxID=2817862 RepID=A0A939KKB4_9CLOT|nr:PTS transporter subunit EIIC [Proteiniclasticum aestuarii]MBO1264555.1 PTS sugar transporter subunit IIC [Proteiniclasticum aestuarii]